MSIIRQLGTPNFHYLAWVTPLGRLSACPVCLANDCLLCLTHTNVSVSHAELRWTGGGWTVRDMGSTNKTYRNGEALPSGIAVPLRAGDKLVLGTEEAGQYEVEISEPRPLAVEVTTGRVVPGSVGELCVDDWSVVFVGTGWELRRGETVTRVRDGARVDNLWVLRLPTFNPTVGPEALSYYRATLILADPGGDGKYGLHVEQGGKRYDGGTFAPWRTLWALADRRVDDERRKVAPSQVGWMTQEEIADQTGDSTGNVEVHLIRIIEYLKEKVKTPAGMTIAHADSVISRRHGRYRLEIEAQRIVLPD